MKPKPEKVRIIMPDGTRYEFLAIEEPLGTLRIVGEVKVTKPKRKRR